MRGQEVLGPLAGRRVGPAAAVCGYAVLSGGACGQLPVAILNRLVEGQTDTRSLAGADRGEGLGTRAKAVREEAGGPAPHRKFLQERGARIGRDQPGMATPSGQARKWNAQDRFGGGAVYRRLLVGGQAQETADECDRNPRDFRDVAG